jgi:hypothetical protein
MVADAAVVVLLYGTDVLNSISSSIGTTTATGVQKDAKRWTANSSKISSNAWLRKTDRTLEVPRSSGPDTLLPNWRWKDGSDVKLRAHC